MIEEEHLKPIRDATHQSLVGGQISPPKELTELSRESLGAFRAQQLHTLPSSALKDTPLAVNLKSYGNVQRRNKQLFNMARPSQVCISQQTESDNEIDSVDDCDSPPHA